MARLRLFASDIKIAHTVFALPFALLSTVMAWKEAGGPIVGKLGLILLCMVTARTVAMAMNRVLDARLDALNPRTARRAIPSQQLSRRFYFIAIAACAAAFVAGCAGFLVYGNALPLMLAFPVLVFLSLYPFLKRFTRLCHYYLGAALALAPLCAWIAILGNLAVEPVIIAAAVLLWTAGFDIIYACQDYPSDLATGTFSIPAKLGIAKALWISRLTHAGSAAMLVLLGWYSPHLSVPYFVGASLAILLLIVEQAIVRPTDLSRIGLAFFTMNGIISLLLGTLGIVDVLMQ